MRLGELVEGGGDARVTGFAIDHRKVAPGTVFGAFRGARFDGEDFAGDAVRAGAVAVVARPEAAVAGARLIGSPEPRRTFAALAAKFFAPFPDTCVAVTGTNGKTSTVELARQLWRLAGHRSASVGTLGITTADDRATTGLTTPDVVTFLSNMAGLAREGVTHAAFEASSHGLDQYRTEGVRVRAAAFTNLSRDHLDYHGDMDAYFDAKMRLFREVVEDGGTAVVWTDDPRSEKVVAAARARGLRVMTVGARGETLRLVGRESTPLGQTLRVEFLPGTGRGTGEAGGGAAPRSKTSVHPLHHPADGPPPRAGEDLTIRLPMIGAYQAANALVAAALVIATGGDPAETLRNLGRVQPVRGRLERAVITTVGAPVYVDYAHTPDALDAATAALRPHVAGRLITVVGAGGDRDAGKREGMGAAAARGSDLVIVTDDNPRGEDPAAIRAAVLAGAPRAQEIGDRRAAIGAAIGEAREGDIVLVAGKGHEVGQIVGAGENRRVLPFDDVQVARQAAGERAA